MATSPAVHERATNQARTLPARSRRAEPRPHHGTWHRVRPAAVSRGLLVALAALVPYAGARGQEGAPSGAGTTLTVSGHIQPESGGAAPRFDIAALARIGTATLSTSTPWTDGVHRFEGVLGQALLLKLGAMGEVVRATALDDYTVNIPFADFSRYQVLFAYKMDGHYLRLRDGGPLWLVYPYDEFPELAGPLQRGRWVPHLTALEVQ